MLGEAYEWADIIILHLTALHEGVTIARRFNKPVVHLCHNNHFPVNSGYIVYNSNWLKEDVNLPLPSIVVHPPTKAAVHAHDHYHAKYITLINTNENKGGAMLKALATALPQMSFLGVHGGYDKNQMYQPVKNIQYRHYDPNGFDYSDTRIIIVPSKMESWSLVAAEAMANGIPVICSDLPGLRENCGDAAIYATSTREYADAILRLNDRTFYSIRSTVCRTRFMLHDYDNELNNFYNFIENIVMKGKETVIKQPVVLPAEKKPKLPKEKKEYKGLPTQKK